MSKMFVPVNTPLIGLQEKKYLAECIDSGWISSEGPFVSRFEAGFSAYVDRSHGIAVSSGSAALDVAVQAIGIGKGDEVIMPTFTIISPALSILRAGATPVLTDSHPKTWNMDVDQIESKITKQTKAILIVHIYGLPVDVDPVLDLCKKHGLLLIEDAAEMHGQTYRDKKCGSFGNISVFSFYPNKNITSGEGGMIVTDDKDIADRCRRLRNLAFEPKGPRFIHYELGWNYRMTNMQAAIGVAQLEKIADHLAIKRQTGGRYNRELSDTKGFSFPITHTDYAENIYCMYGVVADDATLAQQTVSRLKNEGVDTRPFFWCMHEQPVFKEMGLFKGEKYPYAERLARTGFYLPCGLGITDDQLSYVVNKFKQVVA